MTNLFDYLTWRGDLTFTQDPPNGVDALIFAALAYVPLGGRAVTQPWTPITLRQAAQETLSMPRLEQLARTKNDIALLRAAAETTRFGLNRLCRYRSQLIPEQDTQFAAVTFLLDDGSMMLAYRGTDNSLVGWKEDFNMSFQETVPAQRLAAQYLKDVAAEHGVPMRVCGHSKGGNLAVFAAASAPPMVQRRILEVYNHDGPGFSGAFLRSPGYQNLVSRIHTLIPQSSVIGMLLEHEDPYTVIRSKSVGIMQHDPYSWEVMGAGFLPMEDVTENSQFLDATIKAWCAGMTNEERGKLVDALFALLSTAEVERAVEIFHPKNLRTYIKTLSGDETLRKLLSGEFLGLVEAAKATKQRLEAAKQEPEGEGEGACAGNPTSLTKDMGDILCKSPKISKDQL